jgi:hypothetical protein
MKPIIADSAVHAGRFRTALPALVSWLRISVRERPASGISVRKRPIVKRLFRYGRSSGERTYFGYVSRFASAMTVRVRHCIECPKCSTRYLVGFSPYRNGSYLLPIEPGFAHEWTLYCTCGRPPISSRWRWNELHMYAVSNPARDRGYGPPEEIVRIEGELRCSQ